MQREKPLLVQAFMEYVHEQKILYKGRKLSRMHVMQLDAHQFANSLIKKTGEEPEDFLSIETI